MDPTFTAKNLMPSFAQAEQMEVERRESEAGKGPNQVREGSPLVPAPNSAGHSSHYDHQDPGILGAQQHGTTPKNRDNYAGMPPLDEPARLRVIEPTTMTNMDESSDWASDQSDDDKEEVEFIPVQLTTSIRKMLGKPSTRSSFKEYRLAELRQSILPSKRPTFVTCSN